MSPARARSGARALRDEALLIKRVPYGESSLVVQAVTRGHGRVHLLAKGAYRATSRYAYVLDLFDTLDLSWLHRPEQELQTLQAGDLLRRRRALTSDLARYRAGLAMLDLAGTAFQPGKPDTQLFDALEGGLDELAAGRRSPRFALVAFDLAFLQNLGLAPALAQCAACGGPAPPVEPRARGAEERVAFSAGAGGRLCPPCAQEARASGRRVGTIPRKVLDGASRLQADGGESEAPSEELLLRVRDLLERFLAYHLDTLPRSQRAFLSVPNRNAPGAPPLP